MACLIQYNVPGIFMQPGSPRTIENPSDTAPHVRPLSNRLFVLNLYLILTIQTESHLLLNMLGVLFCLVFVSYYKDHIFLFIANALRR